MLQSLSSYLRYVNYLSAAQLYLKDNFFLREPLRKEHIKDRILGHWGTVPGQNFIYAHISSLIARSERRTANSEQQKNKNKKSKDSDPIYHIPNTNPSFLFVSGPGHGAPAVLSNLFAEGTLEKFYPELSRDEAGTGKFITMFSWPPYTKVSGGTPGGFPSHCNPGTPGTILEGGELGYSLATSFGSVFDHPDLITVCIVGDGEAETGPLAASWQSVKFLNPATSGAVLPILHLNGYKITGPTIFGCMSDEEIASYFRGLGWEPVFVEVGEGEKIKNQKSKIKENPKQKDEGRPPFAFGSYRTSSEATSMGAYKTSKRYANKGGLSSEALAKEERGDFSDDHAEMSQALDDAYGRIVEIQREWRKESTPFVASTRHLPQGRMMYSPPRWPVIILRSPKGWTGVKELHGKKVEGTQRSHGIPLQSPKTDPEEFTLLKNWLESYRVTELVDKRGKPLPEVLDVLPSEEQRMGRCKYAFGGNIRESLRLPEISNNPSFAKAPAGGQWPTTHTIPKHALDLDRGSELKIQNNVEVLKTKKSKDENPVYQIPYTKYDPLASSTIALSDYLAEVIRLNQTTFRFFCPDETESNKFNSLFTVTDRAFLWPVQPHDEHNSPNGRVMEMLSEHTLQGWLQGYLLTGGHGVFVTYEAFAMVVASMVDQYAKFLKQSKKHKWRTPVASLNYILTSVGWRQEHNGYSHQNPSFISNILEKHGDLASVYFPCDATVATVILEDCLKRTDGINIIVANKAELPQWLTVEEAREELKTGVGIWDTKVQSPKSKVQNEKHKSKNTKIPSLYTIYQSPYTAPDLVFAAAGDIFVGESIAAIRLLNKFLPGVQTRFVNVSELTALGVGDERYPLALDDDETSVIASEAVISEARQSPYKQAKNDPKRSFSHYFTKDKPVIFAFHGYPGTIKQLLWNHAHHARFSIHGYQEEGSTTTPFDMLVVNRASRYHLVLDALDRLPKIAVKEKAKAKKYCEAMLKKHTIYIRKFGKDMEEVG